MYIAEKLQGNKLFWNFKINTLDKHFYILIFKNKLVVLK